MFPLAPRRPPCWERQQILDQTLELRARGSSQRGKTDFSWHYTRLKQSNKMSKLNTSQKNQRLKGNNNVLFTCVDIRRSSVQSNETWSEGVWLRSLKEAESACLHNHSWKIIVFHQKIVPNESGMGEREATWGKYHDFCCLVGSHLNNPTPSWLSSWAFIDRTALLPFSCLTSFLIATVFGGSGAVQAQTCPSSRSSDSAAPPLLLLSVQTWATHQWMSVCVSEDHLVRWALSAPSS